MIRPSAPGRVPRPPAPVEAPLPQRQPGPGGAPELRAAAVRVLAQWRQGAPSAAAEESAARLLGRLVAQVEAPGRLRPAGIPPADRALLLRLLDRLRAELLRGWASRPPGAAEVVERLSALERVREALEAEPEPGLLDAPEGVELLSEIAHDLRSPLTSILFLSEILWRGDSGGVNEEQRSQLGLIYGAALGLISLVSDLIEFARGGERFADAAPAPFSVEEVMEAIRSLVEPMVVQKGLKLRIVPPGSALRVGYRVPLSRVLLNLATNAIKATDEGEVEIAGRPVGPTRVEFWVRDTGPGIDSAGEKELYRPFRRAQDRHGYDFSGSGLGLGIALRLLHAMGSQLHFETRPGWGTRFHFVLELPPQVEA